MLPIKIAHRAQRDLENIYDYGAANFGVAQANDYAAQLIAATHRFAEFPEIGVAVPGRTDALRRLSCGAHMLLYRRTGKTMLIARVLHGRMDIDRHV